jgi:ribosome-binding protein aMBF1 (putative translation factor)
MKNKRERKTSSASAILHKRIYADQPERLEGLDRTRREMALGMKIRRIREAAGLTQQQLAQQIATQPSAISRIEDADYDGHSMALLARVAEALDMRLIIDFEPKGLSKTHKLKM